MNPELEHDIQADYRRHAAPHITTHLTELVVETAQGATLHCAGNRRVIDLASGGFGYAHPKVKAAVARQIRKAPLSSRILVNRGLAELAIRLDAIAPGALSVSYVCNSGEEALDSALKLAKGHWPARPKVVVGEGGDYGTLSHGVHFAGIGSRFLSGLTFKPTRVPLGSAAAIAREIDATCAAVLLEPLALDAGTLEASAEFWRTVRQRCDETGALLIVSELRTGLGRSGRMFAIEASGIVPDVLVVGNALSGGHISVGAYVTTPTINNKVYDRRNPTLHGSTTGANPASCAAALAALAVIEEEGLADLHRHYGQHAQAQLAAHGGDVVRHVQTLGSLIAIDFDNAHTAEQVRLAALRHGVLLRPPHAQRLLLNPPLTISADEFSQAIAQLIAVIAEVSGARYRPASEQAVSEQTGPARTEVLA